jgi:hypothetical protein
MRKRLLKGENLIRSRNRNVIRPVCFFVCLFSVSAVLAMGQSAALPDAVVITVGGLKITAAEVDKIVATLPPQNRQYFASPAGRAQFADFLVRTKLFVREAEKRHLEDREDVKLSMALFRESLLSREVEKELVNEIKVTNEEAKQFLDANAKSFEQARVRRIVVRSASTEPVLWRRQTLRRVAYRRAGKGQGRRHPKEDRRRGRFRGDGGQVF